MTTKPLLSLEQVSKAYAAMEGGEPVAILKNLNLQLQAGDAVAIVGPSGSGKSTLLQIMGTLDQPSEGRVLLEGEDLAGKDPKTLAGIRNLKIGFVFQAHHLLPQCTVLENVLIPTLAATRLAPPDALENRALKLLERVGLSHRLHHRPGQISGGERQRAAVVRALINQPRLVLADEPTGALDQESARLLGTLLVELNREHQITLVVVTHALDLATKMDRVFELREGRLEPFQSEKS